MVLLCNLYAINPFCLIEVCVGSRPGNHTAQAEHDHFAAPAHRKRRSPVTASHSMKVRSTTWSCRGRIRGPCPCGRSSA